MQNDTKPTTHTRSRAVTRLSSMGKSLVRSRALGLLTSAAVLLLTMNDLVFANAFQTRSLFQTVAGPAFRIRALSHAPGRPEVHVQACQIAPG
jgi:hypothetical protein